MANEIKIEISSITTTTAYIEITSSPVEKDDIASIKIYPEDNPSNLICNEVIDVKNGDSFKWSKVIEELDRDTKYCVQCDIDTWSSTEKFITSSGIGIFVSQITSHSAYITVFGPPAARSNEAILKIVESDNSDFFTEYIQLEPGINAQWEGRVTGLTPETTYTVILDYNDNYTRIDTTFSTPLSGIIGTTGCEVTIENITSHSAEFSVTRTDTSIAEIDFIIYIKREGEGGLRETKRVNVRGALDKSFSFEFLDIISDTTYVLKAPDLDDNWRLEFTTNKLSGRLYEDINSTTSSSIRVSCSGIDPDSYDDSYWCIRKSGTGKIIDFVNSDASSYTFNNLESGTEYYVYLELTKIYYQSDTTETIGIYVTTLPSEDFAWTYAGMDKDGNPIKGENKGDGAEYFFITATEWNEYVTKLCEAKDQQVDGVGTELLPSLLVEANDPFTATLYSNVLGILWSMDGIGEELIAENFVDVKITPSHLNSIKDRLNNLL